MAVGYLYVDGESHYIRSQQCLRELFGSEAELTDVQHETQISHESFPHAARSLPPVTIIRKPIRACPEAKFFWDSYLLYRLKFPVLFDLLRAVYFTSLTGDTERLHDANVYIRQTGFEPYVIKEAKQLERARATVLKQNQLIEKAKGVDIGLTVRLLEDAQNDNFDCCLLATSDVDYLPVIEAVRRRGKQVYVLGYDQGIAKDSPFFYLPDHFIDLGVYMKNYCRYPTKNG